LWILAGAGDPLPVLETWVPIIPGMPTDSITTACETFYFQPNPTRKILSGVSISCKKSNSWMFKLNNSRIHSSNSYYLLIILDLCMGIEN